MGDIERSNLGHLVSIGLCFINHAGYEFIWSAYV